MTNRKFLSTGILSLLLSVLLPQLSSWQNLQAQEKRFHFKIDPKTPLKHLLPVAPKASSEDGPLFVDDLAKVPEVQFQEPFRINGTPASLNNLPGKEFAVAIEQFEKEKVRLLERMAQQNAKIDLLNLKKPDHFMELLVQHRRDLAGLPFVIGEACRDREHAQLFRLAVQNIRPVRILITKEDMERIQATIEKMQVVSQKLIDPSQVDLKRVNRALIAASMQMIVPESLEWLKLIPFLAELKEKEASQALVRLALYSDEKEIRSAALKALEKRDDKDVRDALLHGLQYPWPIVAKNAANALIHLQRTDLVTELIAFLCPSGEPRWRIVPWIVGRL